MPADSVAEQIAQRSDQYFPLDILSGDTFNLLVTWTDSDGSPIDLTGATYEWSLQISSFSHVYTGSTQVVPDADPTTGRVNLHLTAAESASIVANTGKHFLRVTLTDGSKTTLMNGDVYVRFNS